MQNITMKRAGRKLTVEFDLSRELGPSASGKVTMVATTRGFVAVPRSRSLFIGVHIFKRKRTR